MIFEMTAISGGVSRRRPSFSVLTPYCFSISAAGANSELPELASERHVLFVAQRLLAKPHNEIIEPGAADRVALE